jgi:hypothetical protein
VEPRDGIRDPGLGGGLHLGSFRFPHDRAIVPQDADTARDQGRLAGRDRRGEDQQLVPA